MNYVKIKDEFWDYYTNLINDVVIPYQWEILNDIREADGKHGPEPSCAVRNFKIAAGLEEGNFYGMVFQDSDVAKWLEAVGYSLKLKPDDELAAKADEVIGYIEKAQQPDGYLNTYYILNGLEKRFTNLTDCHEFYCLGHMIEAAVSYYEATGKRVLLDVVCRYSDLVDSLFGPEDGKMKGYAGHQEIELALVRLYETTGEKKYLNLAKFFLDERGKEPCYFIEEWEKRGKARHWGGNNKPDLKYHQAHLPVRLQTEAVGHAVRAVYMYTGMAYVARKTNDDKLLEACRVLWKNITEKQLYITGGIGQTSIGEAFTFDYDLPNDTVYSETCAAIGLIFFARQMLIAEPDGRYADVMERALYNTVLAGISRDGQKFLYVNPLEVWPEASEKAPVRRHIKPERSGWFACACCPPNVARLIMSLGDYIYTMDESNIYVHLYISGEASFDINGSNIILRQETQYPANGDVKISVSGAGQFTIALRFPEWCDNVSVFINSIPQEVTIKDGYIRLNRSWNDNDEINVTFLMPARLMCANTNVRANAGKAAITRGPIVYCAEEADNCKNLSSLIINGDLREEYNHSFFGGAVVIKASGEKDTDVSDELYFPATTSKTSAEITFIPYYLWGNRGIGEMSVWMRYSL